MRTGDSRARITCVGTAVFPQSQSVINGQCAGAIGVGGFCPGEEVMVPAGTWSCAEKTTCMHSPWC